VDKCTEPLKPLVLHTPLKFVIITLHYNSLLLIVTVISEWSYLLCRSQGPSVMQPFGTNGESKACLQGTEQKQRKVVGSINYWSYNFRRAI